MIRRILMYISLIGFFIGAIFVLSNMPSSQENAAQEVQNVYREEVLKRVQVLQVKPQPLEETIQVPGAIEANTDVVLGAAISGLLEKVFVQEGDYVKEGQELFQIDLRDRLAQLKEAKASYDLAVKNYERLKKLFDRGNVTAQEYDEANARKIQMESTVQRIESEVSKGHVYAPISGFIDEVNVDEGEFMHEGAEMGRLLALDPIEVSVGVPEKYADAVANQEQAHVILDALNERRTAKIKRVAYAADLQTNTFETTLVLDNPDYKIRPGMIVQAELVTRQVNDALLVPLFSLVKSINGMKVYIVKDNVIQERMVELGAFQGDQVEILRGLQPNEQVVVLGQQDVVDGQKVNVMKVLQPQDLPQSIEVLR